MTSHETALSDLVRGRFGAHQDRALQWLSDDAQGTVRGRFEAARADNTEADVVAYFDFSHLLRVIGRDEQLRRAMGVGSRNGWDQSVGRLPDLRNLVMHPVRDLVTSKTRLIELHEVERLAHNLLQNAKRALDARTLGLIVDRAEA